MEKVRREKRLQNVEEKEILEVKPDEFARLPISRAGKTVYDVLLTRRERVKYDLLWLFECDHGLWVLVGVETSDGGGALRFPDGHEDCDYRLYPKSSLKIVEDDPFRHFFSGKVVWYIGELWYRSTIKIRLWVNYKEYTAGMRISVPERRAAVNFNFMNLLGFSADFKVDFEEAVAVFEEIYQQKRLRVAPPSLRSHSTYVKFIEPEEAIEKLKKEFLRF
jgi:hypothetical protein